MTATDVMWMIRPHFCFRMPGMTARLNRTALISEDAIMMPNHWTRVEGKDAIGEGAVFRLRNREIVDIGVSCDLAYTVNAYDYTYHPEGGQPQWHKTKNVHIWKRDAAGNWKLHVDIWNSDVPMAAFPDE